MGLVNAKVLLANPKKPELEPIETEALADSGPVHLCITEHIRIQLQLGGWPISFGGGGVDSMAGNRLGKRTRVCG